MKPEFKSMKELTDYLEGLEKRIEELETEKTRKTIQPAKPFKTDLINKNFLVRAFAVWGHFMTANFIVSGAVAIIYFCIVAVLINSFLNSDPVDPATVPTAWLPITIPTP